MQKIDIKPLSANELWTGRRFPTPAYKKYTRDMLFLLPKIVVPEGKLQVNIEVGFSNKLADLDNIFKGFADILQKKYGFDDNIIYGINMTKIIVQKSKEFIKFEIKKYESI
jgi:Holliday junction resolvase RusA-like endonuclease